MSLTSEDLEQVRSVVVDVVTSAIQTLVLPRFDEHDRRFEALDSRLARLESDIKAVQIDIRQLKSTLGKIEGRTEAMEADIKELYAIVTAAQKPTYTDKDFVKLSVEQKVLKMYEDVKLLAHEAGVTLPS